MSNEQDTGCEGPAPACPDCREPLNEDGSCWYCETAACEACGEVVTASALVPVTEDGKTLRCCPGCADEASNGVPVAVDEEETVRETTLTDAELLALLDAKKAA